MTSAREYLTGAMLMVGLLSGCTPKSRAPRAVGMAYPFWGMGFAAIAESTLRDRWGDSAQLPVIIVDPDSTPERVERVVEWTQHLLQTPGMSIIVGPSSSNAAVASSPLINAAGIPEIIPTATSRRLDQAGPWVFRLVGNDSVEGEFLVRQLAARPRLRRVLLLYANDEYGQGLRAGIDEALLRAGRTPTAELPVALGSDFELLLRNELTQRRPDVIVGAFRNPELVQAVAALLQLRARIPVVVGDGAFGPRELYTRFGDLPFEVSGVTFWFRAAADTTGRDYITRFRRMVGRWPRAEDAMIQDALMLAATATREGLGEPRAIRLWLLSLGVSRAPFAGVTGPIDFRTDHPRPFHFGRFVADSAVDAELP